MATLPARPAFRGNLERLRASIDSIEESLAEEDALRPWVTTELRGRTILALDNAAKRAALSPNDRTILDGLARVASLGAATYGALAMGPGNHLDVPLPNGEVLRVEGIAAAPAIGEVSYYRECLLAALAARHHAAARILSGVSIALLRKVWPAYPAWAFLELDALQGLVRKSPGTDERFVAAARAADPKTTGADADFALDIVTPELQLGFRAMAKDQPGFDKWMEVAIRGHHHFFQFDEVRKKQPLSQLALAPLAMAVVAHDLGIRTSIVTDYLSTALVAR